MSSSRQKRQPMADVDHAWLRMDDPTNLMMITGLLWFDGKVDRASMVRAIEERLLTLPRFQHRVVPGKGRDRHHWEIDPAVDLAWHLQEEELPAPGGDEQLRELVSRWMSAPLDRERPLWQTHLIHNYCSGTVMMWRLHHCIGDGIALMLALLSITDLAPFESPSVEIGSASPPANPLRHLFGPQPPNAEEARRHLESIMPAAAKLLAGPAEQFKALGRWRKGGAALPAFGRLALRPRDPKTVFKGTLGITKRVAWSAAIPMAVVESVRSSLGGSVNDVLTNAVAGGLRRYLEGRGGLKKRLSFRAVVPVNLRPLEEMARLGNQFGLVFLSLPIGIGDPRERLTELRRRMTRLKRSFEPVVALRILRLIGAVPRRAQELVVRIFGTKGTAVLTNVPGPSETLYLAGKPIRDFVFWVPQSGRLGMGISIASYRGNVRVGIATDAGLVPDPENLVACFHRELAAMQDLADGSGEA